MSYFRTTIIGIGWVGGIQVAVRVLTFVKFLILVKILSVSDLGLYTIVIIVLGFFDVISDLGVHSFLIQLKKNEEKYLDTAWVISIIRGLLFFLLILVFAYPITKFFKSEGVLGLVLIASIIPLIKGFINPAIVRFTKYFHFGREFTFKTTLAIAEVILSILLVLIFRNVAVLIISLIVTATFEVVLSYTLTAYRPKLIILRSQVLEILNFGKWYTLSGVISFFSQQLDSIMVGRTLGSTNLGLYQIAQKFSLQLISSGGDVISKVMFPIYSKVGSSKKRLLRIFLKSISLVGGVTIACGLILLIYSELFLSAVVEVQLINELLNPFRLFTILGILTVFMSIITSVYLSRGRHDYTTKLVSIRLILMIILIGPFSVRYGITGASLASLLSFLIIFPISIYYLYKLFRYKN